MRRYEKDIEYLEQILKQRCPYCDYSLQKPYKSKRECGRCDFILHGNPKLTAYKEIEEPFDWTVKEDECPECQSKDLHFETDEKELVCQACGLVLKSLHHYTGRIRVDYPFGHFFDVSHLE